MTIFNRVEAVRQKVINGILMLTEVDLECCFEKLHYIGEGCILKRIAKKHVKIKNLTATTSFI